MNHEKLFYAATFALACFSFLSSTRGQESGTDPDVNIIPSASKLQLREGENIELTCSYNGVDIVSVNWIFMNRVLKTDTLSNEASGMNETGMLNLTVMGTDESSTVIYTCSVITGITTINVNITIEILAIPNPHISTNSQGYRIGEQAIITCSAAQTSPPITQLTILGPDNSVLLRVNGTTTANLTVENINEQSFGEYVCLIGNTAGANTSETRLRERGFFQVNMLYQISEETCEEYKRNDTNMKLDSIAIWLTGIMNQECSCDVESTDFVSSFLTCSTEGRSLTYRTTMDYSSESGHILTSTVLRKLQLFFYQSFNKNINISGIVFITVIECPVAISNLTSALCSEPPASCFIYNDPLIYGLTLGGALLLGLVVGALCSCMLCCCVNCLRKKRSYKSYSTSNNHSVVIQNEHELLETKIEEASKTSSEDEQEKTISIDFSGTERSSSFSTAKPIQLKKKRRAKTIHLISVPEDTPPPIPRSPRPSPPQQKRYSAVSLPLPVEPLQTNNDAPVPKKRTMTLSIKPPSSNNDDYHRRTATLPIPSKTSSNQEATYMEVVTEKEMQTADTAALVVVEEQKGSQEHPELYDDIGDLKRDDSPDLTQFDDIITPAKSLPPTQDDVYI